MVKINPLWQQLKMTKVLRDDQIVYETEDFKIQHWHSQSGEHDSFHVFDGQGQERLTYVDLDTLIHTLMAVRQDVNGDMPIPLDTSEADRLKPLLEELEEVEARRRELEDKIKRLKD